MQPKPDFFSAQFASAFQDKSVVEAYQYRPPYPDEAIDILTELVTDSPRTILDVGCGTGHLARYLSDRVDRVDALDMCLSMIEQGRLLPGGDSPNLNWIVGAAEKAILQPPYALITAGDSLHWMDWDVVMPRFEALLSANGYLAILGVTQLPAPWEDDLWSVRRRYSVVPNFQYFDLMQGLEDRGLFRRFGVHRTQAVTFSQSLDQYIESFHGRATFSRHRMDPSDAAAFDNEIRMLVEPFVSDAVDVELVSEIVWGKPSSPQP